MQVLETIQEYVPFKHSFISFGSWIGSKYAGTAVTEEQRQENTVTDEAEKESEQEQKGDDNEGEITEQADNGCIVNGNILLSDNNMPLEMETSFIEQPPSQENLEDECDSSEVTVSRCETSNNDLLNGNEYPHCSNSRLSVESAPKTDPLLFNNIPVEEGSCYSDSENDQLKPELTKQSYDPTRRGTNLINLPMLLERRKRRKRRGNTWHDRRKGKIRCDCSKSGEEFCLIHAKSHSESDINGSVYRIGEDYLADLSDISVTSFSLAEDDTSSGSYVDIDLHHIRRFLHDSGSWSKSDRSFDLSSEWSELHRTISDPSLLDECCSLAEECHESDIPDTASDFSQDSRTNATKNGLLRHHRRLKKLPMTAHHVNESYLENECFCCHCTIM